MKLFSTVLTALVLSAVSLCATASDKTYNETIQINNALDGRTIQEHPKLKADKKMYYMTVEIRKVLGEDQSGITLLAVGEEGPVVLGFFSPESMTLIQPKAVAHTKKLYDYFTENAAIGKRMRVVGAYAANQQFTDGSAPSLGVMYAEFPNAPFNEVFDREALFGNKPAQKKSAEQKTDIQPVPAQEQEQSESSSEQDYCKEAYATGNMPGMTECEEEKLKVEDKRLNQEYKAVMAKLDAKQKKELRSVQRKWIKDRDADCKLDPDGGQAAVLENVSCLREWTEKRADDLAAMKN